MTTLKRINQETFDEVVRENMEEFDMPLADAIRDASDQFTKQGVDLTVLDLSGGAEKQEFLDSISKLQELIADNSSIPINDTIEAIGELSKYLDEKYEHSKRNMRILREGGGYRSLHSLFRVGQKIEVISACIDLIKRMSRLNVDIRDAFEPDGSASLCEILNHQLTIENPMFELMEACLSLTRIATKSENTKVFMMRHGMGVVVTNIFLKNDCDGNSIFPDSLLREACLVIKGLCIHDDIRREMSCAYDNGRYFNNSPVVAPTLMKYAAMFEQKESLASAALSAARSLITTEESVKIMAQHGAMTLPRTILGFGKASSELVRSVFGLMRNLCADDVRKEKLVGDGSLQLLVQALSSEEHSNDASLVEHGLACLAAISLRSPSNASRIVSIGSMEIVVKHMRNHTEKTALQRQACLLIRNIAGRCVELRSILLDAGVENVLRAAGRFQDCVDEAYGALRDLGCEVQRVKITVDGKVEAAYEEFGNVSKKSGQFNPVFEESYEINERVQAESRAPFANSNFDCDDDDCDHSHEHSH